MKQRLLAALAFFLLAAPVYSQEKNRIVLWGGIPISEHTITLPGKQAMSQIDVLEMTDVEIGDKSIKIGQLSPANDDWLDKLTFRIKNISNVTVSQVQMNLLLPEIMPGGPLVSFVYGAGPTLGKSIEPGQTVEMKIVFYEWVTGQINKKSSLSQITKAQVQDITVKLADGRELLSGCFKTTDPRNACPAEP